MVGGVTRPKTWSDDPLYYAAHLAKYISDPSTIRARTLEQFGRAPSLDRIGHLRAAALAARVRFREKAELRATVPYEKRPVAFFECGHENGMGNVAHRGDREVCLTCLRAWQGRAADKLHTISTAPVAVPVDQDKPEPMPAWRMQISPARRVIYRAAGLCGVTPDLILSSSRKRHLVRIRWAVMLALRRHGGLVCTTDSIAAAVGRNDHTTVVHGLREAELLFGKNVEFRELVEQLIEAAATPTLRIDPAVVELFMRAEAA